MFHIENYLYKHDVDRRKKRVIKATSCLWTLTALTWGLPCFNLVKFRLKGDKVFVNKHVVLCSIWGQYWYESCNHEVKNAKQISMPAWLWVSRDTGCSHITPIITKNQIFFHPLHYVNWCPISTFFWAFFYCKDVKQFLWMISITGRAFNELLTFAGKDGFFRTRLRHPTSKTRHCIVKRSASAGPPRG